MPSLTLSIGIAHAITHGDGVWRQSAFESSVRRNAATWEVGVRHGGWSVGYADLLRTESDAYATVRDEDYDPKAKQCKANCDIPARYTTSGRVRGVYARHEWNYGGALVELGALVYRPDFTVTISEFTPYADRSMPKVTVTYRNVEEYRVTPSLGAGWQIGNAALMLRWYPWVKSSGDRKTPDGTSYESLSSLYKSAVTLTASYAF